MYQKITLLSLKVSIFHIGSGTVKDSKFDARAWVSIYQNSNPEMGFKNNEYKIYNTRILKSKGVKTHDESSQIVGVHNDEFSIPSTYTPFYDNFENFEGFNTGNGLTNCKRKLENTRTINKCNEIMPDFVHFVRHNRLDVEARMKYFYSKRDTIRSLFLENRFVKQKTKGQGLVWGDLYDSGFFTLGQTRAHLGLEWWRLGIWLPFDYGLGYSENMHLLSNDTYIFNAIDEKYANKRYIADLRLDGLGYTLWKWRMQQVNYDGLEENVPIHEEAYNGFTGCHSGSGYRLHAPFAGRTVIRLRCSTSSRDPVEDRCLQKLALSIQTITQTIFSHLNKQNSIASLYVLCLLLAPRGRISATTGALIRL